jgi:hypothetical protein
MAGAWYNANDAQTYCSVGWLRAYKNGVGSNPFWDDSDGSESFNFPYDKVTQIAITGEYC